MPELPLRFVVHLLLIGAMSESLGETVAPYHISDKMLEDPPNR